MITPHIKYLQKHDEILLSLDYEYDDKPEDTTTPLYLIPNFDMWALRKSLDTVTSQQARSKTINSIFDYFYALYINAGQALNQIEGLGENVKKFKKVLSSMMSNLKSEENVKKIVEDMDRKEKEGEDEEDLETSLNNLKDMLGEGSAMSEIIDDLVGELGISDCKNPMDLITELFDGDGSKITTLFSNIAEKIHAKINSGELSLDKLHADAKRLQKTFLEKTGISPEKLAELTGLTPDQMDDFKNIMQKQPQEMTDEEKKKVDNIMSNLQVEHPEQFEELKKMFETTDDLSQDTPGDKTSNTNKPKCKSKKSKSKKQNKI